MKKILPILVAVYLAFSPMAASAQYGGAAAEGQDAAAYSRARSADVLGVPISSEGVAITAGASTGTKSQTIYDWIETFLITTLKKTILDRIVDQIISYIQGNGKPQFVTDWKTFLTDAGQQAAGEFAQELGLGFLCSPFNFQVQMYLLPVKKFSQQASCTLNQIVGNIEGFYSDFRSGGWLAYGTAWEPQNNFVGALLMSVFESERRKGVANSAALAEGTAGGGYKSARDSNGNIVTPGATLGSLVGKAVGTDIDFILNAEQVTEYASAIASALINRALQEGIAAVQTSDNPNATDNADAQYNALIANNFQNLQGTLLSRIGNVLTPRQQGLQVIELMFQRLAQYKADLQNLYNQFTNLNTAFCAAVPPTFQQVNVAQTKQSILDEITKIDSAVQDLQQIKTDNLSLLALLGARKTEIEQLQANNTGLVRLQAIDNEISGILDVTAAEKFKDDQEAANNQLAQDITQKLNGYNQQLNQCQNNP